MTKTEYQMRTLAGALDAEGEPVHPGLAAPLVVCPHCGGEATYVGICEDCDDKGWVYPDTMEALIEACQAQGWRPEFIKCRVGPHPKMYWVPLKHPDKKFNVASGYGPTNEAALTGAVFQATEPLAANWRDCSSCKGMPSGGPMGQDPFPDEMYTDCHGTGKVLKEAA